MIAKKRVIRTRPVVLLLFLIAWIPGASCEGCFSIVVGKKASADGYVIVAHNEDDTAPQIVHHHKIPRRTHAPGEKVTLLNGGQLDQVEQTWAYIWSEMPGMHYSDSFINEWGVTVTSDNCPSREDRPEITDGGIGYMLRRLVAQRAKTARQGVLLAGSLVERFGHWLAQRVNDNEVAMVANTYTVRRVDLSDKENFLASDDIIEYTKSRGWYDPDDGPFDFAAVYANPASASHPSNLNRQRSGLGYVCAEPIPIDRQLPFSVVPRRKTNVAMMMQILRHDNRGKGVGPPSPADSGPEGLCRICSGATQTSFVAQLRKDMPLDIGIVYWMCLAPPRTSFYLPYYFGLSDFPAGFRSKSPRPSMRLYNGKVTRSFKADPLQAFWTFSNFYDKVDAASPEVIARVKARAEDIERKAFASQGRFEEVARQVYAKDKAAAAPILARYSNGLYRSSLAAMETIIRGMAGDE